MINSLDIVQMIDRQVKSLEDCGLTSKFKEGKIASLKDLKDEIYRAEKKLVNEMAEDYKAEEIERGIEELNEMSKALEIRKTLKEEEKLYAYGRGIMSDFKLKKGEFICPLCGGRHFGNTLCQAPINQKGDE